MTTTSANETNLSFRLSAELNRTIERAAALTGQTVSDFAVSALVQSARSVIQEHDRTELSNRDRDRFIALLDDAQARPNKALSAAARRYKKRIR